MTHPAILTLIGLLMILPATTSAQTADLSGLGTTYQLAQNRDYTDVVRGLETVDYEIEDISTTFLGRTRITANNGNHRREIIVSRTTGEVLSDQILDLTPDRQAAARQAAIDAASEPKSERASSGIEFSGSLTVGVNSRSGGSGRASISARSNNIGGSAISGGVTYSDGF